MLHNPRECRPLSVERVDAALVARGEDIESASRARLVVGYACALRDGRLESFMGESASTRRLAADLEDAFEALPDEEQVLALGKLADKLTEINRRKSFAAQIAASLAEPQSPDEMAVEYRREPLLAKQKPDRRMDTWLKNARMMCSFGSLLCGDAVEKWRDAKAHIPNLTWKLANDEDGSDLLALMLQAPQRDGRGRGIGSQQPGTIARVWVIEAFRVDGISAAKTSFDAVEVAIDFFDTELAIPDNYDERRFTDERDELAKAFPCGHSAPAPAGSRNFSD